MKPPNYDETTHESITRDDQILDRVRALVGRAIRRQLWILALDDADVQLPVVVPISDYPPASLATPQDLGRMLSGLVDATGARQLIVVLERRGDGQLSSDDKEWAGVLGRSVAQLDVRLRAILVSHSKGVTWVPRDEFARP